MALLILTLLFAGWEFVKLSVQTRGQDTESFRRTLVQREGKVDQPVGTFLGGCVICFGAGLFNSIKFIVMFVPVWAVFSIIFTGAITGVWTLVVAILIGTGLFKALLMLNWMRGEISDAKKISKNKAKDETGV